MNRKKMPILLTVAAGLCFFAVVANAHPYILDLFGPMVHHNAATPFNQPYPTAPTPPAPLEPLQPLQPLVPPTAPEPLQPLTPPEAPLPPTAPLPLEPLKPLKSPADTYDPVREKALAMISDSQYDADVALRILAAGNARYIGAATPEANYLNGKNPFDPTSRPLATVFYSPETQTTPDRITNVPSSWLYKVPIRSAVFTSQELDDLEYGVVNLRTPLVIALSHFPSPEIEQFADQFTNLREQARQTEGGGEKFFNGKDLVPTDDAALLYNLVGPAFVRALRAYPNITYDEAERVVAETIAWQSVETILIQSPIVRSLVQANELLVVAAVVDDYDGDIYWLGPHPMQSDLLKDVPEEFYNRCKKNLATKDDLTEPLPEDRVASLIQEDRYGRIQELLRDCYNDDFRFVPSWNIFHPSIIQYRPWCGFWLPNFTPFPDWYPWNLDTDKSPFLGKDFYIGYNWEREYHSVTADFVPIDRHWADPVFLDTVQLAIPTPENVLNDVSVKLTGKRVTKRKLKKNQYSGPVGADGEVASDYHPDTPYEGWDDDVSHQGTHKTASGNVSKKEKRKRKKDPALPWQPNETTSERPEDYNPLGWKSK